jgi:hypothetical protein
MVDFKLLSTMDSIKFKLKRKTGGEEEVVATRPFYRDVLDIDWHNAHFQIIRSGIVVREALVYKNGVYFVSVRERLGVMTHFDVYRREKRVFTINEKESLTTQEFEIMRGKEKIGSIRPAGLYIPLLSNAGKGFHGNYAGILREEEETMVMAILSVCA